MGNSLEKIIATVLIASRWLMAPLYFGLVVALIIDVVVFFRGLIQAITGFGENGSGVILPILKLIDLILLGNLILIIIGAGVDTMVSERTLEQRRRPEWMGKIDFSALKIKIVTSIIAIAAVYLLETFFTIEQQDKTDVLWSIVVFMSFVIAGVLLAWMDRLTGASEPEGGDRTGKH
ncbi:MAG TPA: YqhA family protein [Anaerolineae bacterium]|nr:YqhA family protein [Anaerolineae bacterium]